MIRERFDQQQVWAAASSLMTQGYSHVSPEVLAGDALVDQHLLHRAFLYDQDEDPEPGQRWRSHSTFDLTGNELVLRPPAPYLQTKAYNPDDGDKERHFRAIDPAVVTSTALGELLSFHAAVAKLSMPHLFRETCVTGIHMVSYRPIELLVATSSPVWLHRDQEEYVAVVLFSASANLGGGENVLSPGDRSISRMLNLSQPFETLILRREQLHAVTPMYSRDGYQASRNVILITFGGH